MPNNIKQKLVFGSAGFLAGALLTAFFLHLFVIQNLQLKNARLASAVDEFAPVQDEVLSLSGTVERVEDTTIFLNVNASQFPLEDAPAVRRVIVTDNTELVRFEELSIEEQEQREQEYQEALAEYEANRQEAEPGAEDAAGVGEEPVPPDIVDEVSISLGDIESGDSITVSAEENIKTKKEFEATRVTVETVPPELEEEEAL